MSSLEHESEKHPPAETSEAAPSASTSDDVPRVKQRPGRSRGRLVAIILLSLALAAAAAVILLALVRLDEATNLIRQQQREIKEQHDLIEEKETFGAAMQTLLDTAGEFDGVLLNAVVPFARFESIAHQAWNHRSNPAALENDIGEARAETKKLEGLRDAANGQATTNSTGTTYEATIDRLSGGFVASVIDSADTLCGSDVLACVMGDDPYTVHFDAVDASAAYMTDWLRTGLSYHEFAHSLQMTNPVPTRVALAAFGGDDETMADCFALTYLDGWSLDNRVWVSDYEYYDVSIGYGYTCDESQRQVVRDWYGQLGFHPKPISQ